MSKNKLHEYARENRKKAIDAEDCLWQHLRNHKLNGWKFRRQHPLQGNMIADFFCAEFSLIIEVDGGIHLASENKERDNARDDWSQELNMKVLRFTNEEVLNDTYGVLKQIKKFIEEIKTSA